MWGWGRQGVVVAVCVWVTISATDTLVITNRVLASWDRGWW